MIKNGSHGGIRCVFAAMSEHSYSRPLPKTVQLAGSGGPEPGQAGCFTHMVWSVYLLMLHTVRPTAYD